MTDTPEFSRVVGVAEALQAPVNRRIEATPEERAALAARLDLIELRELSAQLELRGIAGGAALRLTGALTADLDQRCVVSLEAVPVQVAEAIEEEFLLAPESADDVPLETEISEREPLAEDALDIGEIVTQCLSLALDPYPRREGADLAAAQGAEAGGVEAGPFADLARLKRNGE